MPLWGVLQGAAKGCAGNKDELWGFLIPFPLAANPRFTFLHQPLALDISQKAPFLELSGRKILLTVYCVSHPENSKCIWRASVKGFICPARPLSAASKDCLGCGGVFRQWPGNVKPQPASAAGSPSWHSGRLSRCCRLSAPLGHLTPLRRGHSGHRGKTAGACWEMLINRNGALPWENTSSDKVPKKQREVCTGCILMCRIPDR